MSDIFERHKDLGSVGITDSETDRRVDPVEIKGSISTVSLPQVQKRYDLWDPLFISSPLVPSAAFVSLSLPCFHLLSLFISFPPYPLPPVWVSSSFLWQRFVPTVSGRRANPCLVELHARVC